MRKFDKRFWRKIYPFLLEFANCTKICLENGELMQRKIITYPDKRLFVESKPVERFDSTLHELLDDMYETMINGYGIGLAAIQIGEPLRIFLACVPNENDEQSRENLLEIINPKLTFLSDEKILCNEGCLSVPGFFEEIERFKYVKIEYQDRFGKHKVLETSDLLAVVMQHEFEHLDGHLFIERLSFSQKRAFEKEFKAAQKAKKSGKNSSSNSRPSANSRIKPSENSNSNQNSRIKPLPKENSALNSTSSVNLKENSAQNSNEISNANSNPATISQSNSNKNSKLNSHENSKNSQKSVNLKENSTPNSHKNSTQNSALNHAQSTINSHSQRKKGKP